MTFGASWVPVLTARGTGSTSSSITTGSGRGNTWTSEDRFPQCRTAWKGEYAWSISLLKTYNGQRFLSKYSIYNMKTYGLFYNISPESYPNMACTLFMQSVPSIVKICPSPPLRRSSSSKLSMASDICNWNITQAGGCICCSYQIFFNRHKLKIFMGAIETSWAHKEKRLLHDTSDIKTMCSFSPRVNLKRWHFIHKVMNIHH